MSETPARISDVLQPWSERTPDHPALVENSKVWTYRQLATAVSETQAWLRVNGIRPGDRVMIVGENGRAFAAVLLAAISMDAWPVVVNAHLSPREIDNIRDHCEARRVIYSTEVSPHATEHAKRHSAAIEPVGDLGTIGLGPLNETTQPEPIDADIAHRVAALIYTSGSTGLPKGVMLTNRNLLFTASGSAKIRSLTQDDRLYGILPLSHVVGLAVVFLGSLLSGATVYLTARFDPMAARVTLDKERITVMLGVPSMFQQFLQYAKIRKVDSLNLPALRIISCSGAPLQPAIKAAVERLFGLPLHHGYGITECSPSVAQVRVEDPPRADTSVGPAFPGVELKLVGPDGKPVAAGEVGELHVRGPNIMKGYYRAPEETAAVIDTEGWFNSRDLARMEDGHLFVVGRTKDLIIRFGFNVYPAEVEAVLNAHPAVMQSAVIGRSANGDEEIVAFIQPREGISLVPNELNEYATRDLAPYKRPSQIILLSTLPMTTSGKIAKGELIKLAEEKRETSQSARSTAAPQSASDLRSESLFAEPSQTPTAK